MTCGFDKKTDAVQATTLLHPAGLEAQEMEKKFMLASGETKDRL